MNQSPRPLIIGVAGTNGAGKDTVGEALRQHGFYVVAAREVIGAYARKKYGISQAESDERDLLHDAANEMRRTLGPAAIVHEAATQFHEHEQSSSYVGLALTSIRAIAEAEAIREKSGIIVYVDAPTELRWERVHGRKRDTEAALPLEAFTQKEQAELKGLAEGDPKAIQHIEAVGKLADLQLFNDKTGIEAFEAHAYERLQPLIPARN